MSDDELKKFIPHYGDRVAVRMWAYSSGENELKGDTESGDNSALLERLRKKIAERKNKRLRSSGSASARESKHVHLNPSDDDFVPNVSLKRLHKIQSGLKTEMRMELGWINFDNKSKLFHQVRINNNGGGIRYASFPADTTVDEILLKAKVLFFPDGLSSKGSIDDFYCDIRDYNHRPVSDNNSAAVRYLEVQSA